MTLAEISKLGITNFMTSTNTEKSFCCVTLLSNDEAVFHRMYPFANYPEVTTTNINSYFVERAVDDYKKEVM